MLGHMAITVSLTNMCPLRPTYPSNLPKELQNSYLYDTNKTKVCMAIDPSNIMLLLYFLKAMDDMRYPENG